MMKLKHNQKTNENPSSHMNVNPRRVDEVVALMRKLNEGYQSTHSTQPSAMPHPNESLDMEKVRKFVAEHRQHKDMINMSNYVLSAQDGATMPEPEKDSDNVVYAPFQKIDTSCIPIEYTREIVPNYPYKFNLFDILPRMPLEGQVKRNLPGGYFNSPDRSGGCIASFLSQVGDFMKFEYDKEQVWIDSQKNGFGAAIDDYAKKHIKERQNIQIKPTVLPKSTDDIKLKAQAFCNIWRKINAGSVYAITIDNHCYSLNNIDLQFEDSEGNKSRKKINNKNSEPIINMQLYDNRNGQFTTKTFPLNDFDKSNFSSVEFRIPEYNPWTGERCFPIDNQQYIWKNDEESDQD